MFKENGETEGTLSLESNYESTPLTNRKLQTG